jgi:hypothetical protein
MKSTQGKLYLTALGLEAGCDVSTEGPVLSLNGAYLDLQPGGVRLASVQKSLHSIVYLFQIKRVRFQKLPSSGFQAM